MTLVTLTDAWDRLRAVQTIRISAKSNSRTAGWKGTGTGTVMVDVVDDSTITFTERGSWRSDSGDEHDFNNVYRWTLVDDSAVIRLEHLRFGPDQPVYLLDFAPTDDIIFRSISPHYCGADLYTAMMEFKDEAVYLLWNVRGPEKDEEICYAYT